MQKFLDSILIYGLLKHKTPQLRVNFFKLEDMGKKPFMILGIIYYAIPLILLIILYLAIMVVLFKFICILVS